MPGAVPAASGRSAASASRSTSPTCPASASRRRKGTAKLDSLERPGMTDPKARLEDMDLEGIDQTIMFPGGAGEEWAGLDRDFADRALPDAERRRAEFTRYDAEAPHVGRQAADDRPRGGGRRAAPRRHRARHGRHGHAAARAREEPRPPELRRRVGARPSGSASRSACTAAARRSTRCRSASTAATRASRCTPSPIRSARCWR